MLRSIIRIPVKDECDHYLIRRTKYIQFLILLLIGSVLIIEVSLLVRWRTNLGNDTFLSSGEGAYPLFVIVPLLILHFMVWGSIITRIMNYFYNFVIISPESVTQLKYSLFFKEKKLIAELYRVLSISSNQSGIIQSVSGFGDLVLRLQGESIVRIYNIPKPKWVVEKLEEMKEWMVQKRIGEEEDPGIEEITEET